MTNPHRTWLIAALTNTKLSIIPDAKALLRLAENEGVLLLLEQQLQSHPERHTISADFIKALLEAARPLVFGQMQMLAEQRRVFEVLQQAQVDFLVMKGGALAHWLYEKPHVRIVTDLDILLPTKAAVTALGNLLAGIGYSPAVPAGELVSHEHPFIKPGGPYDKYTVDAHWRLFNGALLQDRFDYAELQAMAVVLPNGYNVLSPVHALFNACGHQALNVPFAQTQGLQNAYCLRWLWDIHAMVNRFNEQQWLQCLQLAEQKQMSAVIWHALHKTQSVLHTDVPEYVLTQLQKQQAQEQMSMRWFTWWPRYQWQVFLASSPRWRGRLLWLGERIWPDAEAMRERYGEAGEPGWRVLFRRLGTGLKRFFGG